MSKVIFDDNDIELISFVGPRNSREQYQLTSRNGGYVIFDGKQAREIIAALSDAGPHYPCRTCDGEYCQKCGSATCDAKEIERNSQRGTDERL